MVMVRQWLAGDVGMVTGRQVDPLDGPHSLEGLEGSKDRGPADIETTSCGIADQVGRAEVTVPRGDEVGDRPPRRRQSVSGAVESVERRFRQGIHQLRIRGPDRGS